VAHWRRYAVLGLLGIGMYNALQYMALQSSTPINVTLVASGMPVWMMLTGWLFFGVPVSRRQVAGAVLSIAGVLLVLARGEWRHVLELRLVAGDLFMILATIAWSLYSWLLLRTKEPAAIRADWASLLAQVAFGAVWSGGFALGEQALGAIRCSGAGRWRRRCCTWRRARPSSPAGARACARRGRRWARSCQSDAAVHRRAVVGLPRRSAAWLPCRRVRADRRRHRGLC
jgi:hypothetical protein